MLYTDCSVYISYQASGYQDLSVLLAGVREALPPALNLHQRASSSSSSPCNKEHTVYVAKLSTF
jgi:hypothetical protein